MGDLPVKSLSGGSPPKFDELQRFLCATKSGHELAMDLGATIKYSDAYYVDGLDHAARQWRVAKALSGIESSGLSEKLKKAYLALVKNQISVAAYEQYCRVFKQKWHVRFANTFDVTNADFIEDLRNAIYQSAARKIGNALDNNLKMRWEAFASGVDSELYPIAVACRHAFAHGQIWGAKELTAPLLQLSDFTLQGVLADIDRLIKKS